MLWARAHSVYQHTISVNPSPTRRGERDDRQAITDRDAGVVDGAALGQALRRIRLRRAERQQEVAERAGISRSTYAEIERGQIGTIKLDTIEHACSALDVRLYLTPRWRGGDLDRLLNGRHAVMGTVVAERLRRDGWAPTPEVSFNMFGERGVIDILAWHAGRRALLVIELKTELVDVNELLGTMDRRLRLARQIAKERDWPEPASVSGWVVMADSSMNRRRVRAVDPLLRSAFPEDGRAAGRWSRDPIGRQLALFFLPDSGAAGTDQHLAPRKRVRRARLRTKPREPPGHWRPGRNW